MSYELFYLGQNEDCSPGGSTSCSSERLLQSRSGRRSYIYIKVLVKGELNTIKHSFYKKFVAKPDVTMKGFRAFLDIRRLES